MNRKRFIGAMIWNQVGRIGEIGLSLLFTIVIVRWMSEASFGTYSTIISVYTLLLYILGLGFSDTLLRYLPELDKLDPKAPLWYLRHLHFLRLGTSLAAALFLWLGRDALANWLNQPLMAAEYGLIAILFITYHYLDLVFSYYMATLAVGYITFVRLAGQFSNIMLIALLFSLSGPAVTPVFLSLLVVNSLMYLAAFAGLPGKAFFAGMENTRQKVKTRLKGIYAFGRDLWIINIVNIGLQGQIDIILLSLLAANNTSIAYYSLASQLIVRLYTLVTAWNGSLNSIIATVKLENGLDGLRRYFGYYYRFSLLAHLLPITGLLVISEPLVALVFGERYRVVGVLLALFTLQNVFSALFGASICPAFINNLGRQNLMVRWRTVFGLLNVVLDILLIPPLGALGPVIATIIANLSAQMVEFWLVRELARDLPARYILKVSGAALVAGFVALLVNFEGVAGLAIKGGLYVALVLLFFRVLRPIDKGDRQILLNLQPRLARILRWF